MSTVNWIAVKSGDLPAYTVDVLVADSDGIVGIAYRGYTDAKGEHWTAQNGDVDNEDDDWTDVIVWALIPPAPIV